MDIYILSCQDGSTTAGGRPVYRKLVEKNTGMGMEHGRSERDARPLVARSPVLMPPNTPEMSNSQNMTKCDIYGDVHIDMNCNIYCNMHGDMYGNMSGDMFGDMHGDMHGDMLGKMLGILSGQMVGRMLGDIPPVQGPFLYLAHTVEPDYPAPWIMWGGEEEGPGSHIGNIKLGMWPLMCPENYTVGVCGH